MTSTVTLCYLNNQGLLAVVREQNFGCFRLVTIIAKIRLKFFALLIRTSFEKNLAC